MAILRVARPEILKPLGLRPVINVTVADLAVMQVTLTTAIARLNSAKQESPGKLASHVSRVIPLTPLQELLAAKMISNPEPMLT